jgi:hypothetical protein
VCVFVGAGGGGTAAPHFRRRRRSNSSAIRGRPALIPLSDWSVTYSGRTEVSNLTRNETVVLGFVVHTDHLLVLKMNLQVWLFYVFGPITSMAARVRSVKYKWVVSECLPLKCALFRRGEYCVHVYASTFL